MLLGIVWKGAMNHKAHKEKASKQQPMKILIFGFCCFTVELQQSNKLLLEDMCWQRTIWGHLWDRRELLDDNTLMPSSTNTSSIIPLSRLTLTLHSRSHFNLRTNNTCIMILDWVSFQTMAQDSTWVETHRLNRPIVVWITPQIKPDNLLSFLEQ